jgi:hypothetical protein
MSQAVDYLAPGESPAAVRPKREPGPLHQLLRALASLRLTVVLFALSLVLVFCGTLAQVDNGVWTVVNNYFRWWYVWVPFQIFFPRTIAVAGGFPFPGGWTIGLGLLLNLLAAHAVRFRLRWNRAGIITLHAGVILLLVGELVTGVFSVEGRMTIDEASSSNFIEDSRHYELAVIDSSDSSGDVVVSIPGSRLRAGEIIRDDRLPFDIEVVRVMANSALDKRPTRTEPATAGLGRQVRAEPRGEVAGTDTEQKSDIPSAYITLKPKNGGEPLGTYLVSLWFSAVYKIPPQPITVGDKRYTIDYRFRREYLPFSLRLIEFRFDRYPGTEIAKNFSSEVRLQDPETHDDRDVVIRMNAPLRYRGQTFYQSSFDDATEKTTVLQVVRNPGAWIPYVSCSLVFLGMLLHFGMNLAGFLNRRVAP